jgi:hypothetical protein
MILIVSISSSIIFFLILISLVDDASNVDDTSVYLDVETFDELDEERYFTSLSLSFD